MQVVPQTGLAAAQDEHLQAARRGGFQPPYRIIGEIGIWVYAMAYGNGRLCIGWADDLTGYDRGYCYRSVPAAFAAADQWDGVGVPAGWKKDLQTQEYRKEFE